MDTHQLYFGSRLKFILTNVQRTCRAWHELIRVSPQIQQALFLKPVYYQLKDRRQPKKNPVLADTIIQYLADQCPGIEINKISRQFDPWPPAKLAAYRREEANWRKMFSQQPPGSWEGDFADYTPASYRWRSRFYGSWLDGKHYNNGEDECACGCVGGCGCQEHFEALRASFCPTRTDNILVRMGDIERALVICSGLKPLVSRSSFFFLKSIPLLTCR